jgi:hypothetical protein
MAGKDHSPHEIIKIIQRGIAGHLTFMAASRGWGTNSELALYPPIGAILQSRGWDSRCQHPLLGRNSDIGAPRTIDFIARPMDSKEWNLAMEIKLIGSRAFGETMTVERDVEKLKEFKRANVEAMACLLIVGRKADIEKRKIKCGSRLIKLEDERKVIADVGVTAWGSVAVKI